MDNFGEVSQLALICENFDKFNHFDNFDYLDNFRVNKSSGINFTLGQLNFSGQTFCGIELTRKIFYLRFGMMDVS